MLPLFLLLFILIEEAITQEPKIHLTSENPMKLCHTHQSIILSFQILNLNEMHSDTPPKHEYACTSALPARLPSIPILSVPIQPSGASAYCQQLWLRL